MSDFHKVGSNYVNLSRVDSISIQSEDHATLHAYGDSNIAVTGDDARALLAKLRGEPADEIVAREKSGAAATVHAGAANQARELYETLSRGNSRRFDFVDAQGNSREATVSKEGDRWVAVVDGERYEGGNEAAAMSAAMNGAA